MTLRIRAYEAADAAPLAQLFFDSVHHGTTAYYTPAERHAWASEVPAVATWHARLAAQTTLVAQDARGPAGFMTLDGAGYIDLAYVHPHRIGTGVGHALLAAVERLAAERGIGALTTHASDVARPFFERHGWTAIESGHVERGGERLVNHVMAKRLTVQTE